jgi:hypothetical protein
MQIATVVRSIAEKTTSSPNKQPAPRIATVTSLPSGDTDRAALDKINETRFVALLEENTTSLESLLDEKLLAIRDRFVAGAIEETRMLQIPNFVFGLRLRGKSRLAR